MLTLDKFLLKNRVALVTGGRRGIGKAIALALAEAGADIAICDYANENDEFKQLTAELQKMGRKCLTVTTDVSKSEQVQEMVKQVLETYGKIDILVNNAGISPITPPVPDLSEIAWDAVIDTNLRGAYLCCRAVSKTMIERNRGSIINISSIEGLSVAAMRRGSSPYGVSKAGIVMLTRGLAWDLGKFNIRVNSIAPGGVKTDMLRFLWDTSSLTPEMMMGLQMMALERGFKVDTASAPEAVKKIVSSTIPLGRIAEPEEIGSAALFLASDAASYITGQTLIVDGGLLA